ncbi:hypothetical protein [Azospirillum agricola]|uniref:hypothetical protein n=1 Tax=Azospirillum agricola TaxID=1720247 RepID=UPI000A0F24FA|nr:hypothetical protein [Azospirillum agricola]SMH56001.1 hypothetical protein SAMN02982994_3960 [Azospirillum lipoferum]
MAIDATTIDSSAAQRTAPRERPSPIINDGHMGGGVEIRGEMSFWDFLDVINPLQHIPIVNTIYRNLTGDTIQPSSRVIGGILYGGPLGGMTAIANAVVEEAQGQDIGDQIMASLGFGGDAHPTDSVAVAAAAGGPATAGSPVELRGGPQAVQTAATPAFPAAAAGQPVKPGATGTAGAEAGAPSLAAQLAAGSAHGAFSPPGKMPPRDTPLASSTMVKHSVPKFAAPMPGSVPVSAQGLAHGNAGTNAQIQAQAQAAGQAPAANGNPAPPANGNAAAPGAIPAATPDTLSETMMRNLAKYEQSRKAAQPAAPTLRVSG